MGSAVQRLWSDRAPGFGALRAGLVCVASVITGRLALLLAMPPGYATPVWPPAGIAVVAVLLWGRAVVPGVFLASLLLNLGVSLDQGRTLPQAVLIATVIATGSSAQASFGAWLSRRMLGPGNPLDRDRDVPFFLILAGPAACVVAAGWCTLGLTAIGAVSREQGLYTAATWWVGDSIGVMLFAPPLLAAFATGSASRLRRWAGLAAPLLVCLVGVGVLFEETTRAVEMEARDTFDRRARRVAAALEGQLTLIEAYTQSIAHAFGALGELDRSEFRALAEPWLEANLAMEAFEWAPIVPGNRLAAFEAASRDAEVPGYRAWEVGPNGVKRAVEARALHAPLLFVEPMSREGGAIGFDLASSPARLQAMEEARDSGGVVGTSGIHPVLYPDEWGALLVAPAFAGSVSPQTVEERRRSVVGFVASVVRVDVIARSALEREQGAGLRLRVSDRGESPPRVLSGDPSGPAPGDLAWSTVMDFGGRTWEVEVLGPDVSARSWVGWTVLVAGFACTGLVSAFVLDASARALAVERQVQERTAALARANDALTRSNLELQRFAYVASHDMREPLRTIAVYSELLDREAEGLDASERGWLRRIVAATRRMQDLVTQLLAFSRVESRLEAFGPVPLEEPVRAALDDLDAALRESGAEVSIGELPSAWCDRLQMVQLFQNLLSNAIKFRRPGVPVRISVTGRRVAGGVEVAVSDNGIGIETKDQRRIFEMFQKLHADARYPGQGIGLATCRRIVERHGGTIWVESTPGEGSVFRFVLPEAA